MHPARLKQVREQALGWQPKTSSALMTKLRAMDLLLKQDGRIRVEYYRQILIWASGNPFDDWQGMRAASMAGRLLDELEELLVPVPEPEVDPWFELDLIYDMRRALGPHLSSGQLRRIDRDAEKILAAENPAVALELWYEGNNVQAPRVHAPDDELLEADWRPRQSC